MSDIADVLTELAEAATAAVYPQGTGSPSVANTDVMIYPGWPNSDALDQDLLINKTHVSVFPKADERNTTRYSKKRRVTTPPAPTLTLTMGLYSSGDISLEGGTGEIALEGGEGALALDSSPSVTVGGTVSTPQNVMMRVSGKDYVYGVQSNDTLASIASALAALVAADIAGTTAIGTEIVIGPGGRLQAARAGGFGTVTREVRRQERVVMITVWAASPDLRDTIAAAIDVALANTEFLTMPDGFGARLIYKNSLVIDSLQKATLYRRDLNYTVEYATTISEQAAAVIAPTMKIKTNVSGGGKLELEDGNALLLEDGTDLVLESSSNETTITF